MSFYILIHGYYRVSLSKLSGAYNNWTDELYFMFFALILVRIMNTITLHGMLKFSQTWWRALGIFSTISKLGALSVAIIYFINLKDYK